MCYDPKDTLQCNYIGYQEWTAQSIHASSYVLQKKTVKLSSPRTMIRLKELRLSLTLEFIVQVLECV